MIPHAHRGTTSSALTRLNVNAARVLGVPVNGYAHLLGLAPEHLNDDLCRAPTLTSVRIAELMTEHTSWPEVALLMTQQSPIGGLGIWDYLITCAPSPLEGIRDAATYLGAILDVTTDSIQVREHGQHVSVTHTNGADLAFEAACAVRACALGLFQARLSHAAQRHLVPVHVALATEVPRNHDALIELYGTRAIDFGEPVSSITFRAADLKAPSPHAPPGLSTVLRRHAEQTLADSVPLHSWLDLFRTALASAYDAGRPTLSAVAQRLSISTRTLQRRLEEHGATWSGEVEAARRARVTGLLRDTDLGLGAIASRTGYADARALRRAVHRWYGRTPSALRAPPGA
ncbi:AraC family transcriptional regulator ligand-binding domain-containing protein [Kitasatospora sp. NPDC094019]|uniref:AraC family transcriptional regulator ligand-binding domain-containing protein n=1 Tax=Kitasatospora sp. NPDC094019 TaxID=3364091 RepID=UPI00381DD63B